MARPRRAGLRCASAALCCVAVAFLLSSPEDNAPPPRSASRGLTAAPPKKMVRPYTRDDVLHTQGNFTDKNAVVIFDGTDDTFKTYAPRKMGRLYLPNYLLVRALRMHFPGRFGAGRPSLQLLVTVRDYPDNCRGCLVRPRECRTEAFAPILSFGSVPKDPTIMPSLVAMPLVTVVPCMVSECRQTRVPDGAAPDWDDLLPQIPWRGSDYPFLHGFDLGLRSGKDLGGDVERLVLGGNREAAVDRLMEEWDVLTPRWRGVVLSLRAKLDAERRQQQKNETLLPWIDVQFFMAEDDSTSRKYDAMFDPFLRAGLPVATAQYMGEDRLVGYRYHIDFGGGGGTSWEGTIRKLAMPGLLFHHESLTKDWFHDELEAWVHYVPVEMDLSDLREKYEWAESNPDEARRIARAGTDFVRNMQTREWLTDTYRRHFVDRLGEVVDAYRPSEDETVESIIDEYEAEQGVKMELLSTGTGGTFTFAGQNAMDFRLDGKDPAWIDFGYEI